ncbi:hypothetical protein PO909_031711 [Leuciscus waleckii]
MFYFLQTNSFKLSCFQALMADVWLMCVSVRADVADVLGVALCPVGVALCPVGVALWQVGVALWQVGVAPCPVGVALWQVGGCGSVADAQWKHVWISRMMGSKKANRKFSLDSSGYPLENSGVTKPKNMLLRRSSEIRSLQSPDDTHPEILEHNSSVTRR